MPRLRSVLLACVAAAGLGTGCAVTDVADLEAGAIQGTVVDKVATLQGGEVVGGTISGTPVYYVIVEDQQGLQTRYEVTYAAFQAVDQGDNLPEDVREALPTLDRERTTWR